ncbi:MAG: hypothetical protein ING19_08180, partial [Azospirillum sp.]|nr:hypothetical protein [Azospirillum sp.]
MSRKFKAKTMSRLMPVDFSDRIYWWVERDYDPHSQDPASHPILSYRDGRRVKQNAVHRIPFADQPIDLCRYGMHASRKLVDAMKHAKIATRGVWIVALGSFGGHRIKGVPEKSVAAARTYLHRFSLESDILGWIEMRAYDVLRETFEGTRERKAMFAGVASLPTWTERLDALCALLLNSKLRVGTPAYTLVENAISILEFRRTHAEYPNIAVAKTIAVLSSMRSRMNML